VLQPPEALLFGRYGGTIGPVDGSLIHIPIAPEPTTLVRLAADAGIRRSRRGADGLAGHLSLGGFRPRALAEAQSRAAAVLFDKFDAGQVKRLSMGPFSSAGVARPDLHNSRR
jgi:hypothetical protein